MQLVLQGLAWEECLAYLESDDVIILGHNFQDHTQKLENEFPLGYPNKTLSWEVERHLWW
jgi:hypothetical protein